MLLIYCYISYQPSFTVIIKYCLNTFWQNVTNSSVNSLDLTDTHTVVHLRSCQLVCIDYALSFPPISQYLPQNVMQPTVLGPLAKGIKILTGKTKCLWKSHLDKTYLWLHNILNWSSKTLLFKNCLLFLIISL